MGLVLRTQLVVFGLASLAQQLVAQSVTIKGASPATITQTAAEYLAPDGFVIVRADSSSAEFGLNRGKIRQRNMSRSMRYPDNLFWVITEVHLRYKPTTSGIEVSVYEDALVLEDDSSLVERRRVANRSEMDNLRAFLEDLRKQVEARTQPATAKP